MVRPRAEKQRESAPRATTRILPMKLQTGDHFSPGIR